MATLRTNTSSKTRLGNRNQVILPQEVCDEVGAQAGDNFRVSVLKTSRKVPAGSIVLSPEFLNTQPWSESEWREKEKEASASIRRGETSGPFADAKSAIKHLKKVSKEKRAKV